MIIDHTWDQNPWNLADRRPSLSQARSRYNKATNQGRKLILNLSWIFQIFNFFNSSEKQSLVGLSRVMSQLVSKGARMSESQRALVSPYSRKLVSWRDKLRAGHEVAVLRSFHLKKFEGFQTF